MYIHYIALNNIHAEDFIINHESGIADTLFLCFKSPCNLIIADKYYNITLPSVILIDSNIPYKYYPTKNEYIDDYCHFQIENKSDFFSQLTFPLNTPFSISNYMRIQTILQIIAQGYGTNEKYYDDKASLLIKLLIIYMMEEWESKHISLENMPHYDELSFIRNQLLSTPEKNWNIEELAQMAHLSQAYFQVMYKKYFHTTCIMDLVNAKIRKAIELLTSTNLLVKEIAEELGYNEVYHFIRQFKKSTGFTPIAYRKHLNSDCTNVSSESIHLKN